MGRIAHHLVVRRAADQSTRRVLQCGAQAAGARKFVLVSSLLTNAPALGQAGVALTPPCLLAWSPRWATPPRMSCRRLAAPRADNPNYKFLNLFGAVSDDGVPARAPRAQHPPP